MRIEGKRSRMNKSIGERRIKVRWRQFLTPVKSIDTFQAKEIIADKQSGDVAILDVRQPVEYESGHIPGAKLIPLPDLGDRMDEIDPAKPTLVYCAVGGRSRVAAQMLSGRGFNQVLNLSGGFKAWKSHAAYGPEETGLSLFTGEENPEEALVIAYSLEQGLRDFYLSMIPKVNSDDARGLFEKLSDIEVMHQVRVFEFYTRIAEHPLPRDDFEQKTVADVVEGGLTTEAYIRMFQPDLDSPSDVVGLAMSIEAQALDLYLRAARKCADPEGSKAFLQIAEEEKTHLKELGKLMDRLGSPGS